MDIKFGCVLHDNKQSSVSALSLKALAVTMTHDILTSEDIDDVINRFLHWIYIIKGKLHIDLKIWILSSRDENNILLIRYAHS